MQKSQGNTTLEEILSLLVIIIVIAALFRTCSKSLPSDTPAKWEQYAAIPTSSDIDNQVNNINQVINAFKYDLQENKVEQLSLLQGMDVIRNKVFEMKSSINVEYKKAEQERELAAMERSNAQKERAAAQRERAIVAEERKMQFLDDMKLSIFSFLLGLIPAVVLSNSSVRFIKKWALFIPQEELDSSAGATLMERISLGFVLSVLLIIIMMIIEYFS